MDLGILLIFRIGLLALMWLFILSIVRVLRKDLGAAAGPAVVQNRPSLPKLGAKGSVRLLKVIDGPLTGSHMDISTLQELTLGRSQDADFVVGDDYASGRHSRLFKRGSDWYIEDLASRNGTYVMGMRIEQPEKVQVGSDIKIGRTTVRLEP
ncbi:FHA domain-containing protein FhaB [Corynebacterium kalinowskii]|uniref:FHA domain-containing protein FhaB n=1 Tax=Corynebacterium kalinowskii TaxID=2675216 RepID=A0A6B8VD26_9CORY|nr:FHA domain-containing protein [Corynebacterium kalinowskii]QGU00939.1 FHA domain-containing protein FhaB [Corynebacterium kalinowskii]